MKTFSLVAAATATLFLFTGVASAQDSSTTFSIAQSKGAATKRIHAAIETLVDDMNFIKRPFARSKLKDTNTVCSKIYVVKTGADVSVTCDNGKKFTTPASGAKKNVIGSDGESKYVLTQKLDGNKLVQTFRGENGSRTSVYTWDPAKKTMTLNVKVSSPKLPRPLKYSLSYKY